MLKTRVGNLHPQYSSACYGEVIVRWVYIYIKITVLPSVNITIYYNKPNILSPNSWPHISVCFVYVRLKVICFTCFGAIAVTHEHNASSSSSFIVHGVLSLF